MEEAETWKPPSETRGKLSDVEEATKKHESLDMKDRGGRSFFWEEDTNISTLKKDFRDTKRGWTPGHDESLGRHVEEMRKDLHGT